MAEEDVTIWREMVKHMALAMASVEGAKGGGRAASPLRKEKVRKDERHQQRCGSKEFSPEFGMYDTNAQFICDDSA